jgi:hypothetical protein
MREKKRTLRPFVLVIPSLSFFSQLALTFHLSVVLSMQMKHAYEVLFDDDRRREVSSSSSSSLPVDARRGRSKHSHGLARSLACREKLLSSRT